MIAVETVIRKLVGDYEFVIIPGFGALLSRQIHASFDKESGIFSPPVKKLAFNEFLKLDDGLLANYISREEKISHPEAVGYVKQYAESLRTAIQREGGAVIRHVGRFQTNVEGKLVFEPDTENHFKDEWYGFSKVAVKTFNTAPVAVSDISQEEAETEVIHLNESKTVKVNWVRWASAAMLGGLMFYVSFFLVTSNKNDYKSTLNPFENFFDQPKPDLTVVEIEHSPETVVVPALTADSVTQDSLVSEPIRRDSINVEPGTKAPAITTEPVSEKTTGVINKKFYLIAGAFKGLKRANILLEELQKKGYTDAIVIPAGTHSSKVTVAVQGFDVEKEAYQASAKLKSVIGEEGWVMKIK